MRPKLKAQDISFSLNNTRFFESVLSTPPKAEDRDGQLEGFAGDKKQKHFNTPRVEPADYASRFFGGQKVVFYKDAKLQEFAPYSQPDGLVRRLIFFSNGKKNMPEEIVHYFRHRRDGLEERVFFPSERRQVDRYSRGNPHALREVVEVLGEKRELHFYNSRLDGLVKHVELYGTKIVEEFEGRDDGMTSHALKFVLEESSEKGQETLRVFGSPARLLKVSEKFRRYTEALSCMQSGDVMCIAKLVYLAGGRMRIDFHPPQNSIVKPVVYLQQIRSLLQFDPEAIPFSGSCKAPPPTEAEVARYRKMQKDLMTRFSSGVLVQAQTIHEWRQQQEAAVHASRKKEEERLLSQKTCILRHDEDSSGAGRVDKAVGDDHAAATAAAADTEPQAKGGEAKEDGPKYAFCKHATLVPTFSAIASFTAHDPNKNSQEEKKKDAKLSSSDEQASAHTPCCSSSSNYCCNSESMQQPQQQRH
ncbi:hypothetical protein Efla_002046 [Eimeria flavescens]